MKKLLTLRFVSRFLHLLAAGYIIGHLFTFFWASPSFMVLHETNLATHGLYLVSGVTVTLSGFLGLLLILYQARPQRYHTKWEYVLFAKMIVAILLTRFTDWLVWKAMCLEGAKRVDEREMGRFYTIVGIIKFIAILIVLAMSVWAKQYREEMTENFT